MEIDFERLAARVVNQQSTVDEIVKAEGLDEAQQRALRLAVADLLKAETL